jgi:hypothetical protein
VSRNDKQISYYKKGMPSSALENLLAEYNSAQLKINHLMKKRPSDFKEQSLYSNLARLRDSALTKLIAQNYDENKLEKRDDIEFTNSNNENNNNNNNSIKKPDYNEDNEDNEDNEEHIEPNNNNSQGPSSLTSTRSTVSSRTSTRSTRQSYNGSNETSLPRALLKEMEKLKAHQPTKSVGPKINMFTGKVMDSETVSIAGENFIIKYDEVSRTRRRDIFLNNNKEKKLTDIEKALLVKLCILDEDEDESSTYEAVRMYLYDFFESLPNCQSSVAILSNRECEVANYVLWSVLLKARQDVQRKIDDAKKKSESDIKIKQYEARLKSMSMRNVAPYNGPKPCDVSHDEHIQIETLIKRLEGKLDSVKKKVNTMKGGGCKLMDSMAVGSEATYKGVETPPPTPEAATGLQVGGGCKLMDSMMVGYTDNIPMKGGALEMLQRIYKLYA